MFGNSDKHNSHRGLSDAVATVNLAATVLTRHPSNKRFSSSSSLFRSSSTSNSSRSGSRNPSRSNSKPRGTSLSRKHSASSLSRQKSTDSLTSRNKRHSHIYNDNLGSTDSTSSTPAASQPKTDFITSTRDHIVDKIIEKIIESQLPEGTDAIDESKSDESSENSSGDSSGADTPSKDAGSKPKKEKKHKEMPEFSLSILASNIRKLNARAGLLLKLQSYIIRILSWQQPTATISVALIYTIICLNPHILAGLPILCVLVFIMAPGYHARHPLPEDLTPARFYRHKTGHTHMDAESEYNEERQFVTSQIEQQRKIRKQKEQRELRERLRGLQNSLTGIVVLLETLEHFVSGIGSFSDEEQATAIYIILLFTLFTTVYFASFIPINIAILAAGWGFGILLHPAVGKQAKRLKEKYLDVDEPIVLDLIGYLEKKEIIIDEPEPCQTVEVFELQRQGLTPRQWTPWLFSPDIYDTGSMLRKTQERPTGTRFLADVEAPPGWKFKDDCENGWEVDTNPSEWVLFRGIRNVEVDEETNWVYDYVSPKKNLETELRKEEHRRKKNYYYSEIDADEYLVLSDDEEQQPKYYGSNGEDDWIDDDEYLVDYKSQSDSLERSPSEKELAKANSQPARGEWRRRRWVRKCYRSD